LNSLELAGLPGAGKSTICRELERQVDGANYAWLSRKRKKIRRSIWFNLYSLPTALRFRRILALAARDDGRFAPTAVAGAALTVLLSSRKRSAQSGDSLVQLHAFLNLFVMEMSLSRLEAWRKRSFLVYDEGYVQRLIGVWLRFPGAQRQAAWDAFIAAIPPGIHCAFLDLPPEQALEQALARPGGMSRVFEAACDPPGDTASLSRLYTTVDGLIRSLESNSKIVLHRIEASSTPTENAARLAALVERNATGRPITVYLRER
jgi:hypothetical protein